MDRDKLNAIRRLRYKSHPEVKRGRLAGNKKYRHANAERINKHICEQIEQFDIMAEKAARQAAEKYRSVMNKALRRWFHVDEFIKMNN